VSFEKSEQEQTRQVADLARAELELRESSDSVTPTESDAGDPAPCARASGPSAARPSPCILDIVLDFDTREAHRALVAVGELGSELRQRLAMINTSLGCLLAGRDFTEQRLYLALRSGFIPDEHLHELACRYAERAMGQAHEPVDQRCHHALRVKRAWLRGEIDQMALTAACRAAEHVARNGPGETSLVAEAVWVATWHVAPDAAWLALRATASSILWAMAHNAVWLSRDDAKHASRMTWLSLLDMTWEYLAGVAP
jgi:hypothetical protein